MQNAFLSYCRGRAQSAHAYNMVSEKKKQPPAQIKAQRIKSASKACIVSLQLLVGG